MTVIIVVTARSMNVMVHMIMIMNVMVHMITTPLAIVSMILSVGGDYGAARVTMNTITMMRELMVMIMYMYVILTVANIQIVHTQCDYVYVCDLRYSYDTNTGAIMAVILIMIMIASQHFSCVLMFTSQLIFQRHLIFSWYVSGRTALTLRCESKSICKCSVYRGICMRVYIRIISIHIRMHIH